MKVDVRAQEGWQLSSSLSVLCLELAPEVGRAFRRNSESLKTSSREQKAGVQITDQENYNITLKCSPSISSPR